MAYLLQQLLTDSARRVPTQAAVASRSREISYDDLDRRSNQLANVLRASGIVRGDRVGLYLTKSIESIVSIFGILKAGAAYVPIDPGAPPKRAAYIVGNCGMKALITNRKRWAALGDAFTTPPAIGCLVFVDGTAADNRATTGVRVVPWVELEQASAAPIEPPYPIEDDLAYILYTSGSTGEPKGVMISHRASLTFVEWAGDTFGLTSTDRLSSHAPLHFDLSVFDIFAAIRHGATVVLVPEELSVFPRDLARWIEQSRISVWYSVPSVLTALVQHGDLPRYSYSNLRTILFAGEVFPMKHLRQVMSLLPRARYFNLYGPTETNVCTYYPVPAALPDHLDTLPIGIACDNTEVFAVDDQGQVVADGETGELWVRGPSLMRGYWGAPEKTGRALVRFSIDAALGDELVYRTGDLVSRTADGNYRFLGRRDNQIKSRGYRIELGEIEAALHGHPDVVEAAAIAVPDEAIGNAIAAIVVLRDGSEVGALDLEAFCAERIPRYMLPGTIEFRGALPKTSTGKTDKPALLQERLAVGAGEPLR